MAVLRLITLPTLKSICAVMTTAIWPAATQARGRQFSDRRLMLVKFIELGERAK
jgi:hypothetical protein